MNPVIHTPSLKAPTLSAAMVVQALGAILAYSSQIALANLLGVSEFGIYSAAVSATLIVSLLATAGTTNAAMRLVPQALRNNGVGDTSRSLIGSAAVVTLTGAICAAGLGYWIALTFLGATPRLAASTAGVIAASTLVHFGSDLGRAVGRSITTYGSAVAVRPAVLLVLIGLAAWFGLASDAATAMWFLVAATLVCFAVQLFALVDSVGVSSLRPHRPSFAFLRRGLPFSVTATLTLALTQIDLLIVAAVLPSDEVGVYAASARVAAGIGLAAVAVNSVLAPTVASADLPTEAAHMTAVIRRAARWSLTGAAALGLPIIAFAPFVLDLFGSGFAGGKWALIALTLGQLGATACGPAGVLLMFSDQEHVAIGLFICMVVLSAAAAATGAHLLGPVGAAIGSAVAMTTGGAVAAVLARRYTGVRTLPW